MNKQKLEEFLKAHAKNQPTLLKHLMEENKKLDKMARPPKKT